jgi:hypothetical protein
MNLYFRSRNCFFLLIGFFAFIQTTSAQNGLQSPESFLGYSLGSRFTPHHRVMDYFRHVSQAVPNVKLQVYGETYEHRPLVVAIVSSPSNMQHLEEIRTNILKSTGLMSGTVAGVEKPVTWLSYNVHGNEASSTEAAMITLYDLANTANTRTQAWLDNTVVIIDPCMNPDGRDRYANWYNQMVGVTPNTAAESREHREPWPGGRANHYLFDMNRDWSWGVLQETQMRLRLYQQWMPQIHVDFHEQGYNDPYYFAPAAEPYHKLITPWQRSFQTSIGRNHAKYFDANGWLYFSKERFDLFYPGYGDTWPIYNGSIGMTYEQGGISAGLGVVTANGDTLTFDQRIEHHHTTGLSTIEMTAQNAAQVMQEFKKFYQTAPNTPYKSYIVKGSNPSGTLNALKAHLDMQGIRYFRAGQTRQTTGFSFRANKDGNVSIAPNDLVISIEQPKGTLAAVLFEPKPILSDSLTYDITAWSLPYAYGVETYALPERIPTTANGMEAVRIRPNFSADQFALIVRWNSFEDARFLAMLLKKGIKVRVTTRDMKVSGQTYSAGSLLLTKTSNAKMWGNVMENIGEWAEPFGVTLNVVPSGMVDEGPDVGSSDVHNIKAPRVALLSGTGMSSLSVGEIWHYFDQQLKYPLTLINADDMGRTDWSRYDVLVMPDGSFNASLDENNLTKLKEWIRGGGKVIAIEDAMRFFATKDGFGLKVKAAPESKPDAPALSRYGNSERASLSDAIPGAIYRIQMDNTHPLGYGFASEYIMLKQTSTVFEGLSGGDNVGMITKEAPISGFVGSKLKKRLQDSMVYGVMSMGRGNIVYMSDSPLFRGFWYSGKLLFSNALFMVGN